ncbi:hypothetical protein FXO37_17550 [Capsicum annuum]|nr:hypothetical protein FXO37_17550 [Capsicum annuum]
MSENLNRSIATTSVRELSSISDGCSNGEELYSVEENVGSSVAATNDQNLGSAPSASTVENSVSDVASATGEQNLNSDGGWDTAIGEQILDSGGGAVPYGEKNLSGTSFVTISDVPIIPSDWENKTDDTTNSDYEDFF